MIATSVTFFFKIGITMGDEGDRFHQQHCVDIARRRNRLLQLE
ncbi:hypothetical protein NIES37_12410 [Tolypothrix tenuis PCC 7101]|uniref:Uncharacterized protein n=1 Tax=Tolypothrix tenuis PCC 7101 TaxID=231146 RepID=A0A1Z4MV53_9CYAN|nr:hypothetical protein NIES37_12410 [Tolypothrix tenuis PCC 7101]BAZ72188.1 hypothetical protein NIES50_07410 [Aulosira laxa NIES-50]